MSNSTQNCHSSPDTNGQAIICRRLSSTVTDVVALEVKPRQTAVGLEAFSKGLAVVVAWGNSQD